MSVHVIAMLAAILSVGIGQTLLKAGAGGDISFTRRLWRVPTMGGYALLALATLLTAFALQELPLRLFVLTSALVYPLISILSASFLKERIRWSQWLGIALIVTGVIWSTFG